MSNIVPANIQVPAHLAGRVGKPSALAQAMAGGITAGSDFPRISIKGARFRVVEDGVESVLNQTTLDVVVVGANPRLSKTWYAKEWNKDAEPAAPDCFSFDGLSPSPESAKPQNDLCASCQWNAWGSKIAPNGQQLKACSDKKRLAVVAADDPTGPIYLLEVTPAALKGLNAYQKELSVRGIAPEIVRTRISFDTDASFPKLKFGFGGFLDEDAMAVVDGLTDTDQVQDIIGTRRPPAAPAIAAPAPAPRPSPVKPAAAVAPPPVEQDETPAPAPKRGFGAGKTAAAPAPAATPKAAKVATAAAGTAAATSLADEIAGLLDEVGADDA